MLVPLARAGDLPAVVEREVVRAPAAGQRREVLGGQRQVLVLELHRDDQQVLVDDGELVEQHDVVVAGIAHVEVLLVGQKRIEVGRAALW